MREERREAVGSRGTAKRELALIPIEDSGPTGSQVPFAQATDGMLPLYVGCMYFMYFMYFWVLGL